MSVLQTAQLQVAKTLRALNVGPDGIRAPQLGLVVVRDAGYLDQGDVEWALYRFIHAGQLRLVRPLQGQDLFPGQHLSFGPPQARPLEPHAYVGYPDQVIAPTKALRFWWMENDPANSRSCPPTPAVEAVEASHGVDAQMASEHDPRTPKNIAEHFKLKIYPDERRVERGGKETQFGGNTYAWEIFLALCKRYPNYYRTTDLSNDVWPQSADVRNTQVHVCTLRKLLFLISIDPKHHRGLGYCLEDLKTQPGKKTRRRHKTRRRQG